MNTLKTAVVVVVLLGVLYGVYQVLNAPDQVMDGQMLPSFGKMGSENYDGGPAVDVGQLEPMSPDGSTGLPAVEIGTPAGQDSAELPVAPPTMSAQELVPPSDDRPTPPAIAASDFAADPSAPDQSLSPPVPPGDDELDQGYATNDEPKPEPSVESSERTTRRLEQALEQTRQQIGDSRYRDALATLSPFYDMPGLDEQQRRQLLAWLDPLAGKVIYSMEHRLEDPYIVRRGESLQEVASRHDVPAQLLENINKSEINDPQVLLPGTELKVVRGPFRAEVQLEQRKLTLFLNELYAGRFDIDVGNDPTPREGVYRVQDKRQWQEYTTRSGQTIPKGHPANPFGQWWIDLGSDVSLHGSPEVDSPNQPTGCISLSPIDAGDIYGILTAGSRVEIRR